MLVLSRQRDEEIVIALGVTVLERLLEIARRSPKRDVRITASIVDIRGDKVRVGLSDDCGEPKLIPMHRGEVQDAVDAEMQRAREQYQQD